MATKMGYRKGRMSMDPKRLGEGGMIDKAKKKRGTGKSKQMDEIFSGLSAGRKRKTK